MNKVVITDDIIDLIDRTRQETLENAWSQVKTAMNLFSTGSHESACFLAMTAIEEAGKVGLLQFVRGNELIGTPAKIDTDELRSILSDHRGKALRSAASALCVNSRARRIYGTHPDNGLELKHGLLLLAQSGSEWMRIRGHCLYTDLDLHAKSLNTPSKEIDSNYAYYFICMAGEVVAEVAEQGLGSWIENRDSTESIEFWSNGTDVVDEFVEEYEHKFDPTELRFFTDPRFTDIRENIAEPIETRDEMMDFGIQQAVNDFKTTARSKGESEEYIEQKASELGNKLAGSFHENIPSKECVTEMERLAEDVNTVVVREYE